MPQLHTPLPYRYYLATQLGSHGNPLQLTTYLSGTLGGDRVSGLAGVTWVGVESPLVGRSRSEVGRATWP